ncbi:hypothetical protein B0A55_01956 [Friedmanniomyces simplex]|uniref:Pal1 cell morphology protein n=1 Tax=Friedmanniomyces simplex TaxID=329884 RepID=A0A4U0XL64_9PEZI|nr:hypothetical protein B0A55_01956 [Friedmanniomyces simplex]
MTRPTHAHASPVSDCPSPKCPPIRQTSANKTPFVTPADRQPSPSPTNNGLTLNLSSNNPFRNRAPSPSPPTGAPSSAQQQQQQHNTQQARMSRNPFLDASEIPATAPATKGNVSSGLTEDIFKDLSLLDKPASNGATILTKNGPPPRSGTLPVPPSGNRPAGSGDRPPRPSRGAESPSKKEHRAPRPRGMSESSVMDEKERRDRRERDRIDRPERTESEERRRRERRKEREERHRREKEKIRKGDRGGDRPLKRPQGLDIIDKLDVTGIYGQGLFHHDGPFDACNPHRNTKGGRRPAPMQAFPADSANMALGGAGPLRSKIDLDKFHGRGEEGFADYAVTRKPATAIINPTDRIEPVHGEETFGLGTSTFLEGAPAGRAALQRRESEDQGLGEASGGMMGGGLTRKKSLAQRFRGMSASRRGGPNGDLRSPDARYHNVDALNNSPPQYGSGKAISAGGPSRAVYAKENEVNPFDNDYESAFDRKGAEIRVAEQEKLPVGPRAQSPAKTAGLVRSVTADSGAVRGSSSNEEERMAGGGGGGSGGMGGGGMGGGFLNRMRSLKGGGRRARVERRDT